VDDSNFNCYVRLPDYNPKSAKKAQTIAYLQANIQAVQCHNRIVQCTTMLPGMVSSAVTSIFESVNTTLEKTPLDIQVNALSAVLLKGLSVSETCLINRENQHKHLSLLDHLSCDDCLLVAKRIVTAMCGQHFILNRKRIYWYVYYLTQIYTAFFYKN
jgi:hypothetical protein